jgi:hypothetical protein
MVYSDGTYLDCGEWIYKILSFEGYSPYGNKPALYKVERICNRQGFAPHKSIRYLKYHRAFNPNYVKVLPEPPKVKRNWLWDKKEI